MKTLSLTSLFVLFLVVFSPVLAQITITSTDVSGWYAVGRGQKELQKSNDTLLYTINAGVTSATQSQTWALPTVQYTDTMLVKNAAPSATPYFNRFPSATHAQTIEITNAGSFMGFYVYTRIANDSLIELGSAFHQKYGTTDTTTYDFNSQSIIKLPIALGSVLPPKRDSSYYGPGNYQISNQTETFDAYGTITLPNGTFSCLRTKETAFYTKYSPGKVDTFTVVRFHWITKEGHQASVSAWKRDSTTGTIRVQEVRYSANVTVPTGVREEQTATPNTFVLSQNYPNPFNPNTTIRYGLPERSTVRLEVYDLIGRVVTTLVYGEQEARFYEVSWQATAPSGIYFYRIEAIAANNPAKSFVQVRKMLLLK